ncbi:HU family DNA-binding protein [Candidatus Phytoplasma solani]|uniref:DNA-binding protein HU n=1 Tax=Candidatus Phytoplasma solani TaxID=69896 RepID=A0A421NXP9_9MOLU|nr:HU family DNA-binding protein [Candidatus Phytoplasma solani]RMI88700.1 DNA-binding protein HU [Candidatus Phytoplasma solani]
MSKNELIRQIALNNGTTIKEAKEFFDVFEEVLTNAITSNEEVVLSPQIGKFILKSRKAQIGHNPQTGEKIQIPVKTVVKFKVSKTIKDQVSTIELE